MSWLIRVLFGLFIFISSQTLYANAIGSDFQLFNPTSDGDQYFTVYSAQTLNSGQLHVDKVFAEGMGETKLIGDNNTEEGRKLNRRVEFNIFRTDVAPKVEVKPAATIPETPAPK